MPVSCAASGCKSRYTLEARENGITFHRFPRSNPALLDKWRLAMKRATSNGELWMPSRYQRLCSLHFKQSCFDTTGQTKRLRDDVIPSIFNFPDDAQTDVSESKTEQMPEASISSTPTLPEAQTAVPTVEVISSNKDASISWQVPLQDHLYFIPDVETLKRKLQASEDSRAQKEKELRNAKDREKRLRQTYPSIYQKLQKRNLLSPQLLERLQPYGDIPLELYKKPESEYSVQQRLFSLTLQLHDPLSYKYLRNEIKLPLPGPRMLRQWLKTDCDKPGISSLALEALLQKKEEHPELYTRACLSVGSMPIQQHITYDSQQNELIGFVNLGIGGDANVIQEVANEALIFVLVGTAGHWKTPIAYFLMKTLTAGTQKEILLHVLHELSDNGFEVVAVTMERQRRNEEMCTLLGCKFADLRQLQTHFSLPESEYKHYILFDVSKERRLISDMLEDSETLQSPSGPIMWQYIDRLMNLQKTSVLQTGNDMLPTTRFSQLMKLKLMVNTLCFTVANALKMLQELKWEAFTDSSATVDFLQVIDRIINVLTSTSPLVQGDKSPVNHNNLQEKLCILQETEDYLLSLVTCDRSFLYQSASGWYILGLLVNITSLKALLPNLLLTQNWIMTEKFSTHHLKSFVNDVQKAGEWGKKPTAAQVKHAVRRLQAQCGLWKISTHSRDLNNEMGFVTIPEDQISCSYLQHLQSPFLENCIKLPDHFYSSRVLDIMLQNSEMYIAGWIVREAFTQLVCNKCRCALVSGDTQQDFRNAYHLLQLKEGRFHFIPSNGTIKTVQTASKEFYYMLNNSKIQHKHSPLMLEQRVLSLLGSTDIFDLKEHIAQTVFGIDNHHFQLLRKITSLYYGLRQAYVLRLTQTSQYKAHVKQILTKPNQHSL
ncbi:DNA transposase THAP9 [Rhinophrynus dorsalis]